MIPQHLLDALSLPPDSTEKDLKRRYAQLIKIHRPDADPEGFARVREAYEAVQTWLRHAQAMAAAPAPAPHPEPAEELPAEPATTVQPDRPAETRAAFRPLDLDDPLVPPADLRDARALLQMFAGTATDDWALDQEGDLNALANCSRGLSLEDLGAFEDDCLQAYFQMAKDRPVRAAQLARLWSWPQLARAYPQSALGQLWQRHELLHEVIGIQSEWLGLIRRPALSLAAAPWMAAPDTRARRPLIGHAGSQMLARELIRQIDVLLRHVKVPSAHLDRMRRQARQGATWRWSDGISAMLWTGLGAALGAVPLLAQSFEGKTADLAALATLLAGAGMVAYLSKGMRHLVRMFVSDGNVQALHVTRRVAKSPLMAWFTLSILPGALMMLALRDPLPSMLFFSTIAIMAMCQMTEDALLDHRFAQSTVPAINQERDRLRAETHASAQALRPERKMTDDGPVSLSRFRRASKGQGSPAASLLKDLAAAFVPPVLVLLAWSTLAPKHATFWPSRGQKAPQQQQVQQQVQQQLQQQPPQPQRQPQPPAVSPQAPIIICPTDPATRAAAQPCMDADPLRQIMEEQTRMNQPQSPKPSQRHAAPAAASSAPMAASRGPRR